jgi:hypothetical protein
MRRKLASAGEKDDGPEQSIHLWSDALGCQRLHNRTRSAMLRSVGITAGSAAPADSRAAFALVREPCCYVAQAPPADTPLHGDIHPAQRGGFRAQRGASSHCYLLRWITTLSHDYYQHDR